MIVFFETVFFPHKSGGFCKTQEISKVGKTSKFAKVFFEKRTPSFKKASLKI